MENLRIAIYGRKSVYSDKSDSIEAQFKLCANYCTYNYNNYEITYYSDEGYTGANMNRPDFSRLLEDIKTKSINIFICYKIDRVSRDVSDFSNFFELLKENNVDFVSVKEQIDTKTPLGRAMLYISSVFAQMERETIAERVKDNMIELAQSGKWAGGKAPLGYKLQKIEIANKKHTILVENLEEIPFLNMVYDTFLEGYSLSGLETYFRNNKIKSLNGYYFSASQIYTILKNPHYATATSDVYDYFENLGCIMVSDKSEFNGEHGIIAYGRTTGGKKSKHYSNSYEKWRICVGLHKPIISAEKWLAVQKRFGQNKIDKTRKHKIGILKGILRCKCGYLMRTKHKINNTNSKAYDNYFCPQRSRKGFEYCNMHFIRVSILDNTIIDILKRISLDKNLIDKYLESYDTPNSQETNIKMFENSIESYNKRIRSLIRVLDENKTSSAAKYIIAQIEDLEEEKKNTELKLKELNNYNKNLIENQKNKDLKYNEICKFVKILDTATYDEINNTLKSIIKECVYDGQNLNVKF